MRLVKQLKKNGKKLTSIFRKAANEILGTKHKCSRRSGVRNWDDELAKIIKDESASFKLLYRLEKRKTK
jgi:hypothetical protein